MNTDHYQRIIKQASFGYLYGRIHHDVPDGSFSYEILEVNPAFEQISGLTGTEITGHRLEETALPACPDGIPALRRFGEVAATREETSFSFCSGPPRQWFKVNVWSPALDHFVATYTPDARMDDLNGLNSFLHGIIENNPLSAQVVDKEGYTLATNEAHLRLFGGETPPGYSVFNDPQIEQLGYFHLVGLAKKGNVVEIPEMRYNAHWVNPECPDKNLWLRVVVFPVPGKDNLPEKYVLIHEDITASKEAAKALRMSEERYRALFFHAPLGIFSFDVDSTIVEVNNEFVNGIGSSREELIGLNMIRQLKDPALLDAIRIALNGDTGHYEGVYHAVTSGKSTPVRGLFVSFPGDDGKIIGGVGLFEDVTERRKTSEALELARQSYFDIFNSVSEAIYVQDENGIFIDVNKGAETMYGCSREDLIGQSPATIAAPGRNNVEEIRRKGEEVLKTGIPARFEFWAKRMNGEIFPKDVIVNRGRYFGKDVLIATARDITEKKADEAALRESETSKAAIIRSIPDLLFVFNKNGDYIDVYTEDDKKLLAPREELLGKNLRDLFPAEVAKKSIEAFNWSFSHNESVEFSYSIMVDGQPFYYEARVVPTSHDRVLAMVRDITLRRQAEEALHQSEQKFRLIAENISDGILILGADTRIRYVSPTYLRQSGYNEQEELGRDSSTIYTVIHPDDRDALFTKIFEAIRTKKNELSYSYRTRHKDGHYIWREDHAKFNYDEQGTHLNTYVICRDITERKNAEQQILLLGKSIEQSPVSIIITNAHGQIEYVNPKFTEITGYSAREAIGNNPRILKSGLHPPEVHNKLWETISSGRQWFGELHNKKKSGELFWENVSISPIHDNDGKITHFVAVKEDITEKKQMVEDLISAKNKAEESDHLKSAFLANMSHEIRTPMNGILGFASLLKEPGLSGEEQQNHISIIEESGLRMLNIINDIIDISKIESGQMEMYISDANINQQTDYIYTFFKPEAEAKGLQIRCRNGLPDHKATISTDSEKLYAILTNLVKNAIKYTYEGSIEFGYALQPAGNNGNISGPGHAGGSDGTAELAFFVKDSGIGIDRERQEAVFERFVQADISDKQAHQGAGLGLSIAKAYVAMLGGAIGVESEPGAGSTFWFTIPYKHVPNVKAIVENEVHDNVEVQLVKSLKILVAEDDEMSYLLLTKLLNKVSLEIIRARTGSEAIEACRKHTDLDLVLMDIKMPEMDGDEATRQIRQFDSKVVIISQTAYGLSGDREKALQSGCNEYLPKPLQKEALFEMLHRFFPKQ